MIQDEASEIFKSATTTHHKINRKPTVACTSGFAEKSITMLVEMLRDVDGEEHGMLCLS